MSKIAQLTPEQQALIAEHQAKFTTLALSTQRIDRPLAATAVKTAYAAIGKPAPEVLFCDSPNAVAKLLNHFLKRQLGRELEWMLSNYSSQKYQEQLRTELGAAVKVPLEEQLLRQLRIQLKEPLSWKVQEQLQSQLQHLPYDHLVWDELRSNDHLRSRLSDFLSPVQWICTSGWFEFCVSVLNCKHVEKTWLAFKSLVETCGWLFPYEKVCIVCDRPIHIGFDLEGQLHGEGEAAIQFSDGFSLYAYQGVRLPERYGKLHPHQWRASWLLEEQNAELRRILIQGIGYGRICQELETVEVDTWQGYTLLEIDADVDEEPICLLKMTCPSTGFIHVTRVPPYVESAKDAIVWVNWEISPEQFAVQT